jgi:cytochrome c oxidase subunit 3
MEVGTLKSNFKQKGRRKKNVSVSGGSGSGGTGKNNGGGGRRQPDIYGAPESGTNPHVARIFTGFLLLAVLMTFGGLMAAYIVVSTNGVLEWRPFDLPYQVWISTAVILASSLTYHIAKKSLDDEEQEKSKKWLLATTVLGAAFVSSQILAWFMLYRRGVYWESNPYAGFFYILTAIHAVHVIGGICALGAIVIRTWERTSVPDELAYRKNMANVVGWYWHFMDALWIVLLVLLGFWK